MCLLLVVDDDELVRESVSAILASLGHDILQAGDGLEALVLYNAKHDKIHLIIMDIMMPIMDGIVSIKAIKEKHPFAKVILMSGHSEEKIPKEADAFLSKPFKSKALCDIVDKILKMA